MKNVYRKPQMWIFWASGADIITYSGGGGGGFIPGWGGGDSDPSTKPDPTPDPWGDDMKW